VWVGGEGVFVANRDKREIADNKPTHSSISMMR